MGLWAPATTQSPDLLSGSMGLMMSAECWLLKWEEAGMGLLSLLSSPPLPPTHRVALSASELDPRWLWRPTKESPRTALLFSNHGLRVPV